MDSSQHEIPRGLRRRRPRSRNVELFGALGLFGKQDLADLPPRNGKVPPPGRTSRQRLVLCAFNIGIPISLGIVAVFAAQGLPRWVAMWVIAGALFLGAKLATLFRVITTVRHPAGARLIAYVFLWPGLDAEAFCFGKLDSNPTARAFFVPLVRTLVGIALISAAARTRSLHALAVGWLVMIGIVLCLHFGLFELVGLVWRRRGIDARPVMQSPASSTAVAKLWSGRWNTAFTGWMHKEVFVPVARRFGIAAGTAAVFGMSGLLHELVISAPARGGYGLPTAYFALQCGGVIFERSAFGANLKLGRGFVGWIFVLMIAGIPAVLLFPPVFVRNVILPMVEALRSL